MGHMPNVPDENDKRFRVTIFESTGNEIYGNCTEIEANDRQLQFTDSHGKLHEFYGVRYHIAEE